MKRVKDLAGWPPEPAGAFNPHGGTFAISPEQVTIKRVVRVVRSRVDFVCRFDEKELNYSFAAGEEKTAKKVEAILESNLGTTLFSNGTAEIPGD